MKHTKALLAALCLTAAFCLGGCNGSKTTASAVSTMDGTANGTADGTVDGTVASQGTRPTNNQSATDNQTKLTVASVVDQMGKSVKMTKVQDKSGSQVGAVDGKVFVVNSKTYELFLYTDEAKLNDAKSGTVTLFGSMKVNSVVNGQFVLYYQPGIYEDAVIQAFKDVK